MDESKGLAHDVTELIKMPALLFAWRCSHTFWFAVLGGLLGAGVFLVFRSSSPGGALAGGAGLLLLAMAVGWFYAGRSYQHFRARLLPDEGLAVQRGVWWRSEVWVPIARLQHVDVNQGPLDRRWQMANLTLHTAGNHDHATSIVGLPVEQAHSLRALLMSQIKTAHD